MERFFNKWLHPVNATSAREPFSEVHLPERARRQKSDSEHAAVRAGQGVRH